ncbi:MAG: DPP IV N-terminal domain-containing protein [Herpetosiphon sp.]
MRNDSGPILFVRICLLALILACSVDVQPTEAAPWAGNRTTFASPRFEQIWNVTDRAVKAGTTGRSWTWGPGPWFDYNEVYQQAPDGRRLVQYFDKARMEINDPANTAGPLGGVTNGLLVVELVSGRMKLGDGTGPDQNHRLQPSTTPVAGDLSALAGTSATTPSYATFQRVATTDNGYRDPQKLGSRVGTTFGADGATGYDQRLAALPGTDIVTYDGVTGHNVPRVFEAFRQRGPVPALAALGFPITDPYWVTARVAGQERQVLVQLYERRTLTYTPGNPPAFEVEMGNVGQHYFFWRYYSKPWAMTDPALPITFARASDDGVYTVVQLDATGSNEQVVAGAAAALLPYSQRGSWIPELPPSYRVVYGDTTAYTGKRQLATLLAQAPLRDRLLASNANDYEPAISPDGTQLIFVSDRDGNPELYLLMLAPYQAAQDRMAIRLTDSPGCNSEHPSWLPDGSGLVYESNCQDGHWQIYRATLRYTLTADASITISQLISPTPGLATRLTTTASDERWPRISPDGSQIVFFSNRDGNTEIYTMHGDGSQQTRRTSDPGRDEAPVWSQDGSSIIFNSDRTGHHELFRMPRDGGELTQLTHTMIDNGYAASSP